MCVNDDDEAFTENIEELKFCVKCGVISVVKWWKILTIC